MNPGDVVSRYKILGQIGQGGMGVVYRAEDTRLHRPVALKFLPPDSLTEQDRQRFLNEARAAAAIAHPNICPVYDVDEADGRVFIAMACVEGMPLSRRMAAGGLDIQEAARIGAQIAAGLEAAHRLGIVHRDIKGGNVMVGEDGHVCILDFGLALRTGATRLTHAGGTLGTAPYMSPEQALGKLVDFRTDIWSLGVLLFEMVTGVLPFRRDHQAAVIYAIVHEPAPPVASLRPAAPPELRRLIDQALRKDPAERWGSAREMAAELRKIAGDALSVLTLDADVTKTIALHPAPVVPAPKRKKSLWIAAAAVLLAYGVSRIPLVRDSHPASLTSTVSSERQVAILPFQVASGSGPELAGVADGMVEILTGALSDSALFHGKVTAVPSSEIRRRAINSAEEARRVYGVNLVVSGSARQTGSAVEFTLNLTDAVKLRQIDSKTIPYDPAKPAEAKSEVVNQLAHMLNFELTPVERKAVTAGDSNAPGAYRAYLEARGLLARYDVPGNTEKAIAAFSTAVKDDPNYALAYAGLAEGYWRQLRATHEKAVGALALRNAERAVRLDPSLAIAQAILGQVYATAGRQQEAIAHLRKAIEMAPGNAEAPRQLAQIFSDTGRLPEAEASYLSATKARPTDWYGFLLLGIFYYNQQRWEDSEKALRNAQMLTPNNDIVYRNLGAMYAEQGRYSEAEKELQRGLSVNRKSAQSFSTLASVLFLSHRYQEAVDAMEGAIELDATRPYFWGNLGIYSKWAPGNEGKSRQALGKAATMMEQLLEAMPDDYASIANLAEYRARLGENEKALAGIAGIPKVARGPVVTRLVTVHELTGHRADAITAVRDYIKTPEAMRQIRDDPDLAGMWADPAFQRAIPSAMKPR